MTVVTTPPPPHTDDGRRIYGAIITALRLAAGQPRAAFARQAHISDPTLKAIELATRGVSRDARTKLHTAIATHWDDLAPRLDTLADPDNPGYERFVADPEGTVDAIMGWPAGTYRNVQAELAKGRAGHPGDVIRRHLTTRIDGVPVQQLSDGEAAVTFLATDPLAKNFIGIVASLSPEERRAAIGAALRAVGAVIEGKPKETDGPSDT